MFDYIDTERLEAEIAQLKAQVIYLMKENRKLKGQIDRHIEELESFIEACMHKELKEVSHETLYKFITELSDIVVGFDERINE